MVAPGLSSLFSRGRSSSLNSSPDPCTCRGACTCTDPGTVKPGTGRSAGACDPGAVPIGYRRGRLPIALPFCADDMITQYGRTNAIWLPEYQWWDLVGRAATFSPRDPLAQSGTKAGGTLTLTFTAGAAPAGLAQGNRYLFAALMIEIGCNDNVTPGTSDVNLTGTFEDGQPFTQTLQFSQGHVGISRFIVAFTRTTQGGAYPCLVQVQNGIIVSEPGVAIPLTAAAAPNDATSSVPTNGIRGPVQTFVVDVVQAATGTAYRVELLSPVGQFWEAMEALFAASVRA